MREPGRGVWLVGATAVLVGAVTLAMLAIDGATVETLRAILRATAKSSLVLFLTAFLASPIHSTWRSRGSAWLIANRRYLGLSFAVSHTVHFAAIVALARSIPDRLDTTTLVFGGLAYVLIVSMAATSNDAAVARLGARRWKRLHTIGLYYVWFIFVLTYLGNAGKDPFALVAVGVLVGALIFRLARRASSKARLAPAH
jgi:DMSO/TMAO reductase YedYZ heme-binding membrane subunit